MIEITEEVIEEFKKFEGKAKSLRVFRYYGMHKIVNAYLGFPAWFPIDYLCYIEHGISFQLHVLDTRLLSSQGEIGLLNNKAGKQVALTANKKNLFVAGAMFVHHRLMNGVEPDVDAKGTISYPLHSTPQLNSEFDWDVYARELSELPEVYQPVSACVYWKDVVLGRHKSFEKYGIPIYSCGTMDNEHYAHNFYQLLKRHKFATSNYLGSYAAYALEMNIPFFIYGGDFHFSLKDEDDTSLNMVHTIVNSTFFQGMKKTFDVDKERLEKQTPQITTAQLEFYDQMIDKGNWESPVKIRRTILLNIPSVVIKKIWFFILKKFRKA